MIQAESVSLVYVDHGKQTFACRDISLEIHEGEFVGILGPSGSGKSSLLYLLSGLKTCTEGSIKVDGEDISKLNDERRAEMRLKSFGFVFQQPFLLGYLSAIENVSVAATDAATSGRAEELLQKLGMAEKAHRRPHELSGGEKQRVCVARALRSQPRVIFADEPTAALDHKNGQQVVSLLNEYRGNGSLVMVTHDPSMLEKADRILKIEDGQLVG